MNVKNAGIIIGSEEIGCEISRNRTQGIETAFGRIGFPDNRSPVTNQLWNGLRLGQSMGAQVDLPGKEEGVAFMELDEMHTYVGSKKTTVGSG
ncbi:hypothetical protein EZS27_037917 [termite gut metagenome]|uniref:Uncharacterized protein n=1 Tax=termite gut metagenome TaxID=433724 RepID=A0A5J4PQR0_9ZZZZ